MKFKDNLVTIKVRLTDGTTKSIKANRIGGESSSRGTYWELYKNTDPPGTRGIKIAESAFVKGYLEKAKALFGRPWLVRVAELDTIELVPYRDWDTEIGGLPDDTEMVYNLDGYVKKRWKSIERSWVIQRKSGATLHVFNNDEVTASGEFTVVLQKLFEGKTIHVVTYETIRHVQRIRPARPQKLRKPLAKVSIG